MYPVSQPQLPNQYIHSCFDSEAASTNAIITILTTGNFALMDMIGCHAPMSTLDDPSIKDKENSEESVLAVSRVLMKIVTVSGMEWSNAMDHGRQRGQCPRTRTQPGISSDVILTSTRPSAVSQSAQHQYLIPTPLLLVMTMLER